VVAPGQVHPEGDRPGVITSTIVPGTPVIPLRA